MSFDLGFMNLSVSGVSFLVFAVLLIAAIGYVLGRITIKGISLGTAGVFVIALLFGALCYNSLSGQMTTQDVDFTSNALKIVENIGLILFVTSVGFIAGPNFFKNLKKNFKSYILLGAIVIIAGGLTAVTCIFIGQSMGEDPAELKAIAVGLLSGALTSTPAFSASKATIVDVVGPEAEALVTVGYGISYLFGVVGVVLFVQLIPKLMKVNMAEEVAKIAIVDTGKKKEKRAKAALMEMDSFGIMPFALVSVLGILLGSLKFFDFFSLTTTGGCLIMALIFGHFGKIGKINMMPDKRTLEIFRELGLMFFLIGAGIAGGARFVEYFKVAYFIYGVFMTIVPMIIGFLFAKFVLKLSLLNNLGSVTGAMTSTPALGTLINASGSDDVASAYAATYPIALIAVVLVCQFIIILM